jgi:hypothetical protein
MVGVNARFSVRSRGEWKGQGIYHISLEAFCFTTNVLLYVDGMIRQTLNG